MLRHVIPSRLLLLHQLPKNGVVAEVGVFAGWHAKSIQRCCQPEVFYLIDAWKHQEKGYDLDPSNIPQEDFNRLYKRVQQEFPDCKLIRRSSVSAAAKFQDEYFDWVYIDANHYYKQVMADLNAWWPKVKYGLCGHDYCTMPFVETEQAVNDFGKGKLKVFPGDTIFHPPTTPSWLLRKV